MTAHGCAKAPAAFAPFMSPAMQFAWLLRADLRQGGSIGNHAAQREFCAWWRLEGPKTYPGAWATTPGIDAVAAEQVSVCPGLKLPRMLRAIYRQRADLQAAFPLRNSQDLAGLLQWYGDDCATTKIRQPPKTGRAPLGKRASAAALPGVNVVGYPRGEFGIGEDLRMLVQALDEAGIPVAINDVQSGSQARQQDTTLASRITARSPYNVTIFCQTAFDMARCYLERKTPRRHGYTIGYWPWELPRFPECWSSAYGLVDEIWAASQYTFDAYAADRPHSVYLMPPVVAIHPTLARPTTRQPGPYTFLTSFDPNSCVARKNPAAALQAFQAAFPANDTTVRLHLHINGTLDQRPEFIHLHHAAYHDRRCHVTQGTMDRLAYQRMMQASDCLLSPHRAEGFGRNIAEAILLGVNVLATGASGCLDFLEPAECLSYTPRKVAPGDYPFGDGQTWFQPDMPEFANALKRLRHTPAPQAERAARLAAQYNPRIAAARIGQRLNAIHARRLSNSGKA